MQSRYCTSCDRVTGHKRALGWGTFFAVALTAGFWLLALPFYPQRCIICGEEDKDSRLTKHTFDIDITGIHIVPLIIGIIFFALSLYRHHEGEIILYLVPQIIGMVALVILVLMKIFSLRP